MLEVFRRNKLEVIAALGELCAVARTLGASSLAERVDRDVVQKLASDRFHLVVVGEFNHGKTTFVNALLGASVLPVGVTPTTAVIHHVVYATEPGARVVSTSGAEESRSFDEVRSYTASGGKNADDVRFLEIGYPAELLRERLVLVDTPGVNDLSLTRAEITYDYIPRSDAVLFVLDAGQPLKESERQFLQQQLIGRSRDKIVFVVAKADIWSTEEREEALAYVSGKLGELVSRPRVFAVSSHAALSGAFEQSGLPELIQYLADFLAEHRGSILLANALGEGLSAVTLLTRAVQARRRAASMTPEQLTRRIDGLQADLAGQAETLEKRRLLLREEAGAIKAWARRDLDRFCDDVTAQLPQAIERATPTDLKQHLGAFLEQAFRDWAAAESREIGAALEQLSDRVLALLKEDAREAGKRLSDAMGTELKTPRIEVDTFAYDLGVFAVLSVGLGVVFANALLGGILLAAAPALALWNRDRTTAEVRKRALELAPTVLREAAAKTAPKIDEMVDEFVARLEEWLLTATDELHRDVLEVLMVVRGERDQAGVSAEDEVARCDAELKRLAQLELSLNGLRSSAAERHDAAPMASVSESIGSPGEGAVTS